MRSIRIHADRYVTGVTITTIQHQPARAHGNTFLSHPNADQPKQNSISRQNATPRHPPFRFILCWTFFPAALRTHLYLPPHNLRWQQSLLHLGSSRLRCIRHKPLICMHIVMLDIYHNLDLLRTCSSSPRKTPHLRL